MSLLFVFFGVLLVLVGLVALQIIKPVQGVSVYSVLGVIVVGIILMKLDERRAGCPRSTHVAIPLQEANHGVQLQNRPRIEPGREHEEHLARYPASARVRSESRCIRRQC